MPRYVEPANPHLIQPSRLVTLRVEAPDYIHIPKRLFSPARWLGRTVKVEVAFGEGPDYKILSTTAMPVDPATGTSASGAVATNIQPAPQVHELIKAYIARLAAKDNRSDRQIGGWKTQASTDDGWKACASAYTLTASVGGDLPDLPVNTPDGAVVRGLVGSFRSSERGDCLLDLTYQRVRLDGKLDSRLHTGRADHRPSWIERLIRVDFPPR